jgi:hypothetical protein
VGEWRRERKRQTQRKGFGFSPCTVYDAEIHMIVVSHCYWSFPCNFRPFQFYNVCPVFLGVLLLLLLAAPSRSSATQTVAVIYHTFFLRKNSRHWDVHTEFLNVSFIVYLIVFLLQ